MKFCSECGSSQLTFDIPSGDNRPRYVCPDCDTIHYQNPRIIAGVLPVWNDKVLLCKRAIQPRLGYWTLPAGFLENGETLEQGAARETMEEAAAPIDMDGLYTIFNLTHIHQVYIFFRGRLIDGEYGVGEESSETRLFAEEEIPWNELAFPTINKTLRYFFQDRKDDHFPVRVRHIDPSKHLVKKTGDK